jgi:hypothetical protein
MAVTKAFLKIYQVREAGHEWQVVEVDMSRWHATCQISEIVVDALPTEAAAEARARALSESIGPQMPLPFHDHEVVRPMRADNGCAEPRPMGRPRGIVRAACRYCFSRSGHAKGCRRGHG